MTKKTKGDGKGEPTTKDWARCFLRQAHNFLGASKAIDKALAETDLVKARVYMVHAEAFVENAAACVNEITKLLEKEDRANGRGEKYPDKPDGLGAAGSAGCKGPVESERVAQSDMG